MQTGTWLQRYCRALLILARRAPAGAVALRAETPDVGVKAPAFTLSLPEGKSISLGGLEAKGKVVLIVLRGYPGYQCPYCQRQAHDFQLNAGQICRQGRAAPARLSRCRLPTSASTRKEFLAGAGTLPPNYHLVLDPDYNSPSSTACAGTRQGNCLSRHLHPRPERQNPLPQDQPRTRRPHHRRRNLAELK